MLFVPPQHGKSQLATVRWPVWRLERDPSLRVCIAAYNQRHANRFSRGARRIAEARGLPLADDRVAVEEWETTAGGSVLAVGVGAGITGNPVDLLVIDDPIKSREEAESEAYRERVWDWYTDDLYTRLQPGAAVVLIMTRWHLDDLAGRILASEDAPHWTVVNLPAEAEENDPLNRAPGEALCPDRFPLEVLQRKRLVQGSAGYLAMYQQRPIPREGSMFKREWLSRIVGAAPANPAASVRFWDKAGTADGGAYTCGVLMVRDGDGLYYVADVVRGQWSAEARNRVMLDTARRDGPSVAIWVEQEPGSGGKESAEVTLRMFAGWDVHAERATGDKATRALPFAAQCEAGNVRLVRTGLGSSCLAAYVDELTSFPSGRYKDQVDASSGAFNKLCLAAVVDWGFTQTPDNRTPSADVPEGVFLS